MELLKNRDSFKSSKVHQNEPSIIQSSKSQSFVSQTKNESKKTNKIFSDLICRSKDIVSDFSRGKSPNRSNTKISPAEIVLNGLEEPAITSADNAPESKSRPKKGERIKYQKSQTRSLLPYSDDIVMSVSAPNKVPGV